MVKVGEFEVGQVLFITSNAKRVARVLSLGETEISVPSERPNRPPSKEVRKTVTALVCTPARPIPGHVTAEEADQGLVHRLRCKRDFHYDLWTETWIDTPRQRVILTGKPRMLEGDWEWVLKVHSVDGRAPRHEQVGAHGRLTGTLVDGAFIPVEDVYPQLFEELGVDEKTQAELEQAVHDKQVIENHERQKAAEAKEARKGPAAECKAWGPNMKLKAQLAICGLEKPTTDTGNFNDLARTKLDTYLTSIGINPWDVMMLGGEDFKEAVDNARQKMTL